MVYDYWSADRTNSSVRIFATLWLEGLRPAKDIEDRFIEGCRYRFNVIVSLVRKPCQAYWLKRIHLSLLFSSSRWFWLKFDYEMPIAESTNLYSNNTEAG